MSDYNIVKILDGIYVSDTIVPQDYSFIMGNKIIRLIGWTIQPYYHDYEQTGVEEIILTKNVKEAKFPSYQQLKQAFKSFQIVHQQLLCGLFYSQTSLEAALICVMYLMFKFQWKYQSSYFFIKHRIENFQFSQQAFRQLQKFQNQLRKDKQKQLKQIKWEYQFLKSYKTQNDEQVIIINTIKNKLKSKITIIQQNNYKKKTARIKWADQIRPSSPFSTSKMFSRSSVNIKPKKQAISLLSISAAQQKQQQQLVLKDLQTLESLAGNKNLILKQKKSKQKQLNWQNDSDYLQLKQISRTNFNDRRFTSSLKKRGSGSMAYLKKQQLSIPNTLSVKSINSLLGIYTANNRPMSGKKPVIYSGTNAKNFITGLKKYNKDQKQN